jgi:hypothetical protein
MTDIDIDTQIEVFRAILEACDGLERLTVTAHLSGPSWVIQATSPVDEAAARRILTFLVGPAAEVTRRDFPDNDSGPEFSTYAARNVTVFADLHPDAERTAAEDES